MTPDPEERPEETDRAAAAAAWLVGWGFACVMLGLLAYVGWREFGGP